MTEQTPRPKLPLLTAALVGVIAVAAALGAGHLVAAFVGVNASPYLAVGNAAIDLTPGSLKEFAVRHFGTYDKLVLLLGMAVALLLIAVVAGLASRRRPAPGIVLAVVLGGIGIAAVLGRSDVGQLAVLAPVASLVAGAGTFAWLHSLAMRRFSAPHVGVGDGAEPAGRSSSGTPSRRRFIIGSAGVAVGAGAAGVGGQLLAAGHDAASSRAAVGPLAPAVKAPSIPAGAAFPADGTPTFITPNSDFYRVDTALTVPQVRTEDWSLRVHGMVDRELTYRYDDIRNRRLVERTITLTCVSNPVGGPYISTANFIGVPLRDLLLPAGVHEGAEQLFSTSSDGYTAGTPVDVVLDRGFLAIGMNGEPLPLEHGFPARMVVPGLYGYLSAIKWVVDMELTTFDAKTGYWVPRGYSVKAPIKTENRIDLPKPFGKVPAGKVTVAGIAWAQPKGIAKVEVRVDGGAWQQAELATEVNGSTWRMWRTQLDLRPGGHTVESRATDKTGYTQTSQQVEPLPDGATGWPSIFFTVTS